MRSDKTHGIDFSHPFDAEVSNKAQRDIWLDSREEGSRFRGFLKNVFERCYDLKTADNPKSGQVKIPYEVGLQSEGWGEPGRMLHDLLSKTSTLVGNLVDDSAEVKNTTVYILEKEVIERGGDDLVTRFERYYQARRATGAKVRKANQQSENYYELFHGIFRIIEVVNEELENLANKGEQGKKEFKSIFLN